MVKVRYHEVINTRGRRCGGTGPRDRVPVEGDRGKDGRPSETGASGLDPTRHPDRAFP